MASKKNTVEIEIEAKDKATPTIGKVGKSLKNFRKETDSTSGSIRGMRGGLQNLGHQFQDIAVQVQSNTNPFTIFAQQGSQIASSFGPGGAMIGAVIAVAGALGTALAPSLLDSAAATREADEAMNKLSDSISINEKGIISLSSEITKLSSISLAFTRLQLSTELIATNKAVELSQKSLGESLEDVTEAYGKYQKGIGETARKGVGLRRQVKQLASEYGIEESQVRALGRAYARFAKDPSKRAAESIARLLMTMDSSEKSFIKLKEGVANSGAQFLLASEKSKLLKSSIEDLEGVLAVVSSQGFKYEDPFTGLLESEDSLERFFNSQEEYTANTLRDLSSMGSAYNQFFNNLARASKEGSTAQKVFFAVAQSISAAQSIISGFEAAAKVRAAYAGIIGGSAVSEPLANSYVGLGFANAGLIMGQTIASFDGGGSTGSGSRVGGMDGKGGFPAMLHPNETVIDHTKGQGMGKVEVYNYTGQAVKTLTRGDVQQIIIGEMGNQNSQSRRALTQTSNVQSRGLR